MRKLTRAETRTILEMLTSTHEACDNTWRCIENLANIVDAFLEGGADVAVGEGDQRASTETVAHVRDVMASAARDARDNQRRIDAARQTLAEVMESLR